MVAVDEVETFGAHRCGDDRRARHHRVDDFALHARAVEQRHDGDTGAFDVGHDGRDPTDHLCFRRRVGVGPDLVVEAVADDRERVLGQQIGVDARQDVAARYSTASPLGRWRKLPTNNIPRRSSKGMGERVTPSPSAR